MAVLPLNAVYQPANLDVLRIDVCDDEGSGWSERVGGFCAPPLCVGIRSPLPLPRADVVTGGVSENVVEGILFGNVLGALADDCDELGLTHD